MKTVGYVAALTLGKFEHVELLLNDEPHAVSVQCFRVVLLHDGDGCLPKVGHQFLLPGDLTMKDDGEAARMPEVAQGGAEIVPYEEGLHCILVFSIPPTRDQFSDQAVLNT